MLAQVARTLCRRNFTRSYSKVRGAEFRCATNRPPPMSSVPFAKRKETVTTAAPRKSRVSSTKYLDFWRPGANANLECQDPGARSWRIRRQPQPSAALAHHEETAGNDQARALYRDILAADPDHAESLHLLGLITAQQGRPADGAAMIRRAISLAPGHAPHHNSLAAALCATLAAMPRRSPRVQPHAAAISAAQSSAEIHNNLDHPEQARWVPT